MLRIHIWPRAAASECKLRLRHGSVRENLRSFRGNRLFKLLLEVSWRGMRSCHYSVSGPVLRPLMAVSGQLRGPEGAYEVQVNVVPPLQLFG
jgi:hypothetical protein